MAEEQVFTFRDGFLYCEDVRVKDIKHELNMRNIFPSSPFFVYSKRKLLSNISDYHESLQTLEVRSLLSYAMKANAVPSLLDIVRSRGCLVTLVSGMELKLALGVGFHPMNMILNGNGKQEWERIIAIKAGCLINVDSYFDLIQTLEICQKENTEANILLRMNPDIDPEVHPFISTGLGSSKFGINEDDVQDCVEEIIRNNEFLVLVGLHCHLGSTINNTDVYRLCITKLLRLRDSLKEQGLTRIQYLNIGGGLNINYMRHSFVSDHSLKVPSICELVSSIYPALNESDVTLIVEPGRSITGDTAILSATVLGTKSNKCKNFIVSDAAMTEVIRPSLYGAYHYIQLSEPTQWKSEMMGITEKSKPNTESKLKRVETKHLQAFQSMYQEAIQREGKSCYQRRNLAQDIKEFDIVGPVCESTDFLGRGRVLANPHEGCGLAVFDVGAYCSSMTFNYNLRLRPCEVLVDHDCWRLIRRPDSFEDILAPYDTEEECT